MPFFIIFSQQTLTIASRQTCGIISFLTVLHFNSQVPLEQTKQVSLFLKSKPNFCQYIYLLFKRCLSLLETQKSFFMQGKYAYLKLHGLVLEAGQPHIECLLRSRELMLQTLRSTEALLTMRKSCMLQTKKSYAVLAVQSCLQSFEPRTYTFDELHITA